MPLIKLLWAARAVTLACGSPRPVTEAAAHVKWTLVTVRRASDGRASHRAGASASQ